MNITQTHDIHDTELVKWIEKEFRARKNDYIACEKQIKLCTDKEQNEHTKKRQSKILLALAHILRQYVNSVRAKRGNVVPEFKQNAHNMIEWMQKELLNVGWSTDNNVVLMAIQYGRKYVGNTAIEGKALSKPTTVTDRKRRERLERAASKRAANSLEQFVAQDNPDPDDGGDGDIRADLAALD